MRYLTPGMVLRGAGRVVNVSSGWGAFSDGVGAPGAAPRRRRRTPRRWLGLVPAGANLHTRLYTT